LVDNESRFKAYFRMSFLEFNNIPNHIKEDIRKLPSNRVKKLITPEEKLCVPLR